MRRLPVLLFSLALIACDGGGMDPADAAPPPPPCEYPTFSGQLGLGEVMPNWTWQNVQAWDGTTSTLDLGEFFCSSDYDQYSSIVLVISAGWCPACPEYIRAIDSMSRQLEDAGALVLFVEVETADFDPATSADAATFINGIIADGPGLRIGDADNTQPSAVRGLVQRMPSGYFIRRRDMVIVADQKQSIYQIDYAGLAADPEQTWTPMPPPFVGNCGPADEEASEPNDDLATAQVITFGGEVTGGVCAEGGDFYRIEEAGPWRFDLFTEFLMTREDLNLNLYTSAGERIGGSTQRSNHDWIDYEGPAVIEVYGMDNDSATYRVTLGPQP
ncbi:MAG: thioredoxin family protein [Sandaracinaceae bacterium]|nr:thioredoxin family protein [Sandaracinaceae bacterium]